MGSAKRMRQQQTYKELEGVSLTLGEYTDCVAFVTACEQVLARHGCWIANTRGGGICLMISAFRNL